MSLKASEHGVCFIEFVQEMVEFQDFCHRQGKGPEQFTIVALTLEVQAFLRQQGIPYLTTLDFFNNEGHRDVMLTSAHFLNRFDEGLDLRVTGEIIRETYQDSANFVVQYYINYFLFIVNIIDSVVNRLRPSVVFCSEFRVPLSFEKFSSDSPEIPPHIQEEERLASRIVERCCRRHNLPLTVFPRLTLEPSPVNQEAREARSKQGFKDFMLVAAYQLFARWVSRKRLVLFAGGGGYNAEAIYAILGAHTDLRLITISRRASWRSLLGNCYRHFLNRPGILLFPPKGPTGASPHGCRDHIDQLLHKLNHPFKSKMEGALVYRNVDFWDIFGEKLEGQLFPFLRGLAERVKQQLETLSHLPVRYVISTGARLENYGLGEWARWKQISFVMVAHGTTIAPRNRPEEIENRSLGHSLLLSPVVTVGALQSPLEEEHVKHYQPGCRTVRSGPVLFGLMDSRGKRIPRLLRSPEDPVTIMLASSYKNRSTLRFWAMETPDEYLATCRDLVLAVNEMKKDVRLIIRFHAKLTMSTSDFLSLLPPSNRLTIDRGGRFLDRLKDCDLVVNFSSTTVEEAIQNDVPVLLYDRWKRYQHCQAAEVNNVEDLTPAAVYYLNRPELLKQTLQAIIDRHLRMPVDHDKLFAPYQYPRDSVKNFIDLFSPEMNGA